MKFLVLGAGLQGSACAYDLLQNDAVRRVVLADLTTDSLPPFLQKLARTRASARAGGCPGRRSIACAAAGVDSCLNALPYYFNLEVATLAVSAGVHYADLGGNTAIVFQQLQLDEIARAEA